ncbi:uncharacterized protein LOC135829055 [Sycon ciliatum]|uniref:uncharacterized protein LOC135829055 n=1 Tax=Sycon ciliatum TaxID=27933 RepID=UPI0031F6DEA9
MWRVLSRLGVPDKLISIIRSFHEGMSASIRLGADLLDPFPVGNGLRQGCTMAPILFNLFMVAVVEKGHATIANDEDIGIQVSQFRRDCLFNTRLRECRRVTITECQFADDSSLFAKTYGGAERALATFRQVAASFGLSVNLGKTKFMPMGVGVVASDMLPLGGTVEYVDSFRYLGCQITPDARSSFDVSRRIAAASGAFGALKKAVFANSEFPIGLKRVVYGVTVLAVLLYGAENWTPRQRDLQRLESFHLRSIRMVLGVSRARQMDEHVTTLQVRQWWGDMEQVSDKVRRRRLQWLGHLARMDDRIPRQLLFGALPYKRPPHGPRKRWKDPIKHDLTAVSIGMNEWLETADDRSEWRTRCQDGVYSVARRPSPYADAAASALKGTQGQAQGTLDDTVGANSEPTVSTSQSASSTASAPETGTPQVSSPSQESAKPDQLNKELGTAHCPPDDKGGFMMAKGRKTFRVPKKLVDFSGNELLTDSDMEQEAMGNNESNDRHMTVGELTISY